MKDLFFILRRISQASLAKKLGITRANITAWKVANRVPRTKLKELKLIKQEVKNDPKRKHVSL